MVYTIKIDDFILDSPFTNLLASWKKKKNLMKFIMEWNGIFCILEPI